MITAEYLDSMSDEIEILYAQLHSDILADMARRIKKTGVLTATAGWQARKLQEQGVMRKEIIQMIASLLNKSDATVSSLFDSGLDQSLKEDADILKSKGWSLNRIKDEVSYKALKVGLSKTNATLRNMTGVLQNESAGVFERVTTRTYEQVVSGAFTYDQAKDFASDELLRQDQQSIVYSVSGTSISIEAGVRRAIVTGFNQTVCKNMLDVAEKTDSNLVETTAHYGARPEHQVWQGQIFSLKGSGKYPNFYSSTGYGSVTGLGGANCRHNFHPYWKGISTPQYSKKTIDGWNNDNVTFNGKSMTYYDATQKMRGYERSIRGLKKGIAVKKNLGADYSSLTKRKSAYELKSRQLNEQTEVPLDYTRRRIAKR